MKSELTIKTGLKSKINMVLTKKSLLSAFCFLFLWILILQACIGVKHVEKKPPLSVCPEKMVLMVSKQANPKTIDVNYALEVPKNYIPPCGRLIHTPRLVTQDSVYMLTPVVISGKTYNKIEQRKSFFEGVKPDYSEAKHITMQNRDIKVNINEQILFRPWMASADLIVTNILQGCDRETELSGKTLADSVICVAPIADCPTIRYVQHDVTKKKEGFAHFYYPIGRYQVDPALYENQARLDSMTNLIQSVLNDTLARVKKIVITGVSSPDGSYLNNERLAKERASSVRKYLVGRFQLSDSLIKVDYIAEDWEGLRKLVDESTTITDKSKIFDIIDRIPDLDKREAALRQLPQYIYIKQNILPQLRRVVYEIEYCATEFLEERVIE